MLQKERVVSVTVTVIQRQIKDDFHDADKDAAIPNGRPRRRRNCHTRAQQIRTPLQSRGVMNASLRDNMRAGFHSLTLRRDFGVGILFF